MGRRSKERTGMPVETGGDIIGAVVDITRWAEDSFCYVTTRGRTTGRPHEIEIWFGVVDGNLYLISGGGERSDWVKNLRADSTAQVRVRTETIEATARFVTDPTERDRAAKHLAAKYQGWEEGEELSEWATNGLVIALAQRGSSE